MRFSWPHDWHLKFMENVIIIKEFNWWFIPGLLACCQDLAIDMELRRRNSFGEQQEEEGAPDTSLPLMDENPLSLTVGNGGLVSGT